MKENYRCKQNTETEKQTVALPVAFFHSLLSLFVVLLLAADILLLGAF